MMKNTLLANSFNFAASLSVPLIFALLSVVLGQDSGWDLRNYHLYNGYAFLNHRLELDLAPAGMQTYFNPLIDALYFWAISHFSPITVNFLLGFIQGLNFVLIYGIGRYVLDLRNSHLLTLALLGMLSIWFFSEVSWTAQDSLLTVFPLLSLLLILSTIETVTSKPEKAEWLKIFAAGFVAGLACGFKLIFAPYALAFCLAFFVLPMRWLVRLKLAVFFGLAVLLGLLISTGYWFYQVWDYSGNPLFPQFNDLFHSDLTSMTDPIRDTRFFPRSLSEKLFYPIFFTAGPWRIDTGLRQFGWILIYGALLLLLAKKLLDWCAKKKPANGLKPNALFLVSFFCITYFLWQIIFSIWRYLIAIEVLIPIVFTVLMSSIFFPKNTSRISCLILALVMVINFLGYKQTIVPWAKPYFQVNMPELTNPEPKAVFLAMQPLAWIIPILNTNATYIQLNPNFPVSNAYWLRAKNILANRNGKTYLVYEAAEAESQIQSSKKALKNINLAVNMESCKSIDAFISSKNFKYGYCELNSE
jgi:hypothetical protein